MSYHEKLECQIAAKVEELEMRGDPLRASWIAHAICGEHESGLAENEEAEFWRAGGYRTVREEVRRYISKRHGDGRATDESQLRFPGFDHVQTHYVVEREGEEIGVAALDMTDAEIDTKAAFYRAMGVACLGHADELEKFKEWRLTIHQMGA